MKTARLKKRHQIITCLLSTTEVLLSTGRAFSWFCAPVSATRKTSVAEDGTLALLLFAKGLVVEDKLVEEEEPATAVVVVPLLSSGSWRWWSEPGAIFMAINEEYEVGGCGAVASAVADASARLIAS